MIICADDESVVEINKVALVSNGLTTASHMWSKECEALEGRVLAAITFVLLVAAINNEFLKTSMMDYHDGYEDALESPLALSRTREEAEVPAKLDLLRAFVKPICLLVFGLNYVSTMSSVYCFLFIRVYGEIVKMY